MRTALGRTKGAGPALVRDRRGAAMVEFALVAPILLTVLFGIVGYGGYFWRAHAIQQAANDAARAALPGLTASEREALALVAFGSDVAALGLPPERTTASVAQTNALVTVSVAYDGSRDGFLNLSFVPLPSKLIRRIAAVRLGGL